MESIMSNTSRPLSRKYSATVVARYAPRMRISAGWSEMAAITTDRLSPSGPRSLSMNSLTSLPRSPIRAITLTSACVWRAIIPMSTLFPTPEPAMIAMRWPFPMVRTPLIAAMPRSSGSVIRFFFRGLMVRP